MNGHHVISRAGIYLRRIDTGHDVDEIIAAPGINDATIFQDNIVLLVATPETTRCTKGPAVQRLDRGLSVVDGRLHDVFDAVAVDVHDRDLFYALIGLLYVDIADIRPVGGLAGIRCQ